MVAWGLAEVARRPRATPYAAAVGASHALPAQVGMVPGSVLAE